MAGAREPRGTWIGSLLCKRQPLRRRSSGKECAMEWEMEVQSGKDVVYVDRIVESIERLVADALRERAPRARG
jgi:hypothetical protein